MINQIATSMITLIGILYTIILAIILLYIQATLPRVFFDALWLIGRKTPIGYLLEWRRCPATYYTNNTSEEAGYKVHDSVNNTKLHYKSVGLSPPRDFDSIRGVDEEIIFVGFLSCFVGWSNLAPNRIRIYGKLHDESIFYGTWLDWHPDTRFRGTLLLELDKDRSNGGKGVWVGAAKGGSDNNPSGIRTFPWIWKSFSKVAPYSIFLNNVTHTSERSHR